MVGESAKSLRGDKFRQQVVGLRCLCVAALIVTAGCGRAPSLDALAKKVKAGDTLKECEDRFWGKRKTNFARQVGDNTYLYEFSIYALDPSSQAGARVPVWLCFISDDGYWGTYKLRALRADEEDGNRTANQKALDAVFESDPDMTWQERISQHGPPADPAEKLKAFKAVLAKFKRFPDRFAADSERTAFNRESDALVKQFIQCPFDARANPSTARAIVELFESQVENKYSGHQVGLIEDCVRQIYIDSINR